MVKIKKNILCSMTFSELRAVYVEEHGRAMQDTNEDMIRRMLLACWMPKATDTHSEYSIIIAFPRQKNGYRKAPHDVTLYAHCLSYPNVRNLSNYSQTISINLK